ncbi:MAG: hypothetical protein NUW01_20195, partial [Gemmatimonadaceae bacterium]|nr:hypothetical protein [Gemmatimonadaceae bacterium]
PGHRLSQLRAESPVAGLSAADLLADLERKQVQKGFLDSDSTALWAEGQQPAIGGTPMWKGTVGEMKVMLRYMAGSAQGAALPLNPNTETRP